MPKLNFTQDELDGYLKERPESKHFFYKRTVDIAGEMLVHADGLYPKCLLETRRPNEPLEVKEYREKIWSPKTKPTFSKVFSSLQKIRRSSDWSIKYDGLDEFTKIASEEDIEKYAESHFPYFTSVTNWVFALLLRKYLIDPNAIVFVFPLEINVEENQYLRPFPFIFSSADIIDYRQKDYVVLNNPLGTTYMAGNTEVEGRSYFIVTTEKALQYDQVNSQGDFNLVMDYAHGLKELPVFSIKGILIDQADNQFLYESRIAGMIPELNEAVREYSDLQAAKVLHIYPERWEFTNNECLVCKGTGRRANPSWHLGCDESIPDHTTCDTCAGRGYVVAGPYSKMIIRPVNNAVESGTQIPTPPAGYVLKDVEIVKIQEQGVERHLYNALASINFEFLSKVPLAESGVSKEVDKDELNTTVHSIAEDLISAMDNLYRLSAYYRYKSLYSFEEIDKMLPLIPVPEKFDILSPQHTEEELKNAKANNTNPVIINALEVDYATKRFNADPKVRDRVQLILELDPLPNISEDDKMSRLSNKGITLENYVISSNIQEFVQRAIEEDANFIDQELKAQKEKMVAYAKEQIAANSAEGLATPDDQGGLDQIPGGQILNGQNQIIATV